MICKSCNSRIDKSSTVYKFCGHRIYVEDEEVQYYDDVDNQKDVIYIQAKDSKLKRMYFKI